MKYLLMLLTLTQLMIGCDIFDDDEETAASTSNSGQSLTCAQIEDEVDTSVATEYGVETKCENQVLTLSGKDLDANFTSSCLDATISATASDLYFEVDFSDARYVLDSEGNVESASGDIGVVYDITLTNISGIPDISNIDCNMEFAVDADGEEEPSVSSFRDFTCRFTYDGTEETITKNEVIEFGNVLRADPDCDNAEGTITSLTTKNQKIKAAVEKLIEMADELLASEE